MPVVRKSCKRGCEILDPKWLFVIELAIPYFFNHSSVAENNICNTHQSSRNKTKIGKQPVHLGSASDHIVEKWQCSTNQKAVQLMHSITFVFVCPTFSTQIWVVFTVTANNARVLLENKRVHLSVTEGGDEMEGPRGHMICYFVRMWLFLSWLKTNFVLKHH
jgi:hypothetical protein